MLWQGRKRQGGAVRFSRRPAVRPALKFTSGTGVKIGIVRHGFLVADHVMQAIENRIQQRGEGVPFGHLRSFESVCAQAIVGWQQVVARPSEAIYR